MFKLRYACIKCCYSLITLHQSLNTNLQVRFNITRQNNKLNSQTLHSGLQNKISWALNRINVSYPAVFLAGDTWTQSCKLFWPFWGYISLKWLYFLSNTVSWFQIKVDVIWLRLYIKVHCLLRYLSTCLLYMLTMYCHELMAC